MMLVSGLIMLINKQFLYVKLGNCVTTCNENKNDTHNKSVNQTKETIDENISKSEVNETTDTQKPFILRRLWNKLISLVWSPSTKPNPATQEQENSAKTKSSDQNANGPVNPNKKDPGNSQTIVKNDSKQNNTKNPENDTAEQPIPENNNLNEDKKYQVWTVIVSIIIILLIGLAIWGLIIIIRK